MASKGNSTLNIKKRKARLYQMEFLGRNSSYDIVGARNSTSRLTGSFGAQETGIT